MMYNLLEKVHDIEYEKNGDVTITAHIKVAYTHTFVSAGDGRASDRVIGIYKDIMAARVADFIVLEGEDEN